MKKIMKNYLILDCFVDEPACFGVPPFVSPYPRYIYGALLESGSNPDNIEYLTIETLRKQDYIINSDYELVFLIGGAVVPGKYLGHKIGTRAELDRIINQNKRLQFAAGGAAGHFLDSGYGNLISIKYDLEKFACSFNRGNSIDTARTTDELAKWAVTGAGLIKMHPGYPDLICEIESYRGCPRKAHCSFCSEGLLNNIEFREETDILSEIDALTKHGISRFRIGRQADIIQYKTEFKTFRNGFPMPSVEKVTGLFKALKKKVEGGDIKTLNIDNANPGSIYNFPDESSLILESIVDAISPGDTLALGVESFDPEVIKRNKLKVGAEELLEVARIVNRIGGKRRDGIPVLLPGINLIHGLPGETADTFRINYESLLAIKEEGLLIKRINIRKLLPFPGTAVSAIYREPSVRVKNRYDFYREKIRNEIDHYMLARIYPVGTVLKDAFVQDRLFDYSLAKQIASYSITAKIPLPVEKNTFVDAVVISHRERSVIALPCPININSIPQKALELLPGIGKKTASNIIMQRPFNDVSEIKKIAQGIPEELSGKMTV